MPRIDYSALNPDDPHDAAIIDREWRRMRARRKRANEVRGWVRVITVIATYTVLGLMAVAFVYLLAILLLASAGTN